MCHTALKWLVKIYSVMGVIPIIELHRAVCVSWRLIASFPSEIAGAPSNRNIHLRSAHIMTLSEQSNTSALRCPACIAN
jgi:hypothetical protein